MDNKELIDANFDLEQGILRCWSVTSDINELLEDIRSGDITTDQALDVLASYAVVYENRFNRTWNLYETVCHGLHRATREAHRPVLDPLFDTVVEKQQNKAKKNSKKN